MPLAVGADDCTANDVALWVGDFDGVARCAAAVDRGLGLVGELVGARAAVAGRVDGNARWGCGRRGGAEVEGQLVVGFCAVGVLVACGVRELGAVHLHAGGAGTGCGGKGGGVDQGVGGALRQGAQGAAGHGHIGQREIGAGFRQGEGDGGVLPRVLDAGQSNGGDNAVDDHGQGHGGADVAFGVDLHQAEVVGAFGQRCGGRDAPLAVGADDCTADDVALRVGDFDGVARGAGAAQGGRFVGGQVVGGRAGVAARVEHAGGSGRQGVGVDGGLHQTVGALEVHFLVGVDFGGGEADGEDTLGVGRGLQGAAVGQGDGDGAVRQGRAGQVDGGGRDGLRGDDDVAQQPAVQGRVNQEGEFGGTGVGGLEGGQGIEATGVHEGRASGAERAACQQFGLQGVQAGVDVAFDAVQTGEFGQHQTVFFTGCEDDHAVGVVAVGGGESGAVGGGGLTNDVHACHAQGLGHVGVGGVDGGGAGQRLVGVVGNAGAAHGQFGDGRDVDDQGGALVCGHGEVALTDVGHGLGAQGGVEGFSGGRDFVDVVDGCAIRVNHFDQHGATVAATVGGRDAP